MPYDELESTLDTLGLVEPIGVPANQINRANSLAGNPLSRQNSFMTQQPMSISGPGPVAQEDIDSIRETQDVSKPSY